MVFVIFSNLELVDRIGRPQTCNSNLASSRMTDRLPSILEKPCRRIGFLQA